MIAEFDRFSISMSLKQAQSASHAGRCDEDVKALLKHPSIIKQLAAIASAKLVEELKEYGAWDAEELADHEMNKNRIIWLAACNISEAYKMARK